MAAFTLTENTAAELLAMRLVLGAYMADDTGRPPYHHPFPLHRRAGLDDTTGAKLLALWTNRGWWSPTPSFALGSPTMPGIRTFAQIAGAVKPLAWATWFRGLTEYQVIELVRPGLPEGFDRVGLCPACGNTWPTAEGVPMLLCPLCSTRLPPVLQISRAVLDPADLLGRQLAAVTKLQGLGWPADAALEQVAGFGDPLHGLEDAKAHPMAEAWAANAPEPVPEPVELEPLALSLVVDRDRPELDLSGWLQVAPELED